MTRRDLVAATRRLAEAVALTDAGDAEMADVAARLSSIDRQLRAEQLPSVPRTSFEDSVGAPSYVWQWASPVLPEVRMDFEAQEVRAVLDGGLGPVYAGPPGLLHGGVASMLLDAALASLVQHHGIPSVTASLSLDFLAPTPIDASFVIRGRLDEAAGRKVRASGEIVVGAVETVRASGLFIRTDARRA